MNKVDLRPVEGRTWRLLGRGAPWRRKARRVVLGLAWVFFLFSLGLGGLQLAGFRLVATRGESMEPTIPAGSLLLARRTAPEHVQVGDVIAFSVASVGVRGIVHRVVALENDGGPVAAMTMGDNNPAPDPEPLVLERPVAKVMLVAPHLGWWVTPTLGWYLLAIAGLLWLRMALRWYDRRGGRPATVPKAYGTQYRLPMRLP